MDLKNRQEAATPSRPPPLANRKLQAIGYLKAEGLDEATPVIEGIVPLEPGSWRSLHLLGLIAYKQGELKRAARLMRRCLAVHPGLAEAYSDLGVILKDLGEMAEAQAACERAIALKPGFLPAYANLGAVFKARGKFGDAAQCYRRAVAIAPGSADAHASLGAALVMLGRTDEALAVCRQAVTLVPSHAEALIALGHALRAAGSNTEAIDAYRRAIALKPDYGPVHSDLGCALHEAGQIDDAIRAHGRAIGLRPDYAEAQNNLGVALSDLGRHGEALEACRAAIGLKPDYAEAYSNLGVALAQKGLYRDAAASYLRALEFKPALVVAYVNLAGALSAEDQLDGALAASAKALAIAPSQPQALAEHYRLRRQACDWDGIAAAEQVILASTFRQGHRIAPLPVLNMHCGPEAHLLSARAWANGLTRAAAVPSSHRPLRSASGSDRLRIGYLSADFRANAAPSLLTGVIERHDRRRFEIFGYCYGRDDGSDARRRLMEGVDKFAVIAPLAHADAARRIRHDGIDILVDLNGYLPGARPEILACRPAPIQVSYLGYPGPMGASFIDYVIADDFSLPMDQQPFYDEKIVQLPGCYQPSDTKRPIVWDGPSRAECGLPAQGFVFCCFNASYKISQENFALWVRLLQGVPGSVLWLLESHALVRESLRAKAASMGLDPARLVFAPKLEFPKHLARHRHADLFLDTLPVNARMAASDAIWAGLPVLTCAGESFVGRVCGSLLRAVGCPELITYWPEQYETMALALARDPDGLAAIRDRLRLNRQGARLFDAARYTRGLEAAFEHMAELHDGDGPRPFSVAEVDDAAPAPRSFKPPVLLPPQPAQETLAERPAMRIRYEACPLCDGRETPLFKAADCTRHPRYDSMLPPILRWLRCEACGHVFTEATFTPMASELIAAKVVPPPPGCRDIEARRLSCARIVDKVARTGPLGDWLDVGAGDSALMFAAEEWGFRPAAIDLRRDNAEALRALGYEAYACPLEALDAPGRFGAISMVEGFPRLRDPRAALGAAHRLLAAGGALFLAMPNMATSVWRALDAAGGDPYWGEIEHHHNFTRERLYALLADHGFRPARYDVCKDRRAFMEVLAVKL
ncbi:MULTISPECIES: tetratricopeptide repeat protein [Rhodomicrobium]|uniref:O-linked N-acetylglucosamine transferase family protein n=1 Tax=Rhodomicrobium TaxID=1068 RepID=UPI000B4AD7EF|nr:MULTISPECIES: tetratricopeptide repeat protein [Rhodomicrobium]